MDALDKLVAWTLPIVPKPLVARVSRRYIAGETLEEAVQVTRELNAGGIRATLDVLGESVDTPAVADRMVDLYVEAQNRTNEEGLDANCSVKLTSMGLLFDEARCLTNMRRIVEHARTTGNTVRIDMEDSPYTDATLRVFRTLRRELPNVGCVLQAYLRRTMRDALDLSTEPVSVRVCKGIYVEPRTIAYKDKELVRRNFVRVVRTLFERDAFVAIATHDEIIVWECQRLIQELGLGPDRYEFQMLLGVDEQLRDLVVGSGHPMRIYIPFGNAWYAYSLRRLRENPAIAGHVMRAALGLGPEE